MLVFLQIPRSTTSPYKAFRDALGDEAVGWIGRNLKDADLENPEKLAPFKVIGGRITLARALTLPNMSICAAIISDPVVRTLGQWNDAIGDVNHPFHHATHTFMLRELFEEAHPFAATMSNIATRMLLPKKGMECTAANALAAIQNNPFIIGEADSPKAFTIMVTKRLGLEAGALKEASFHAPPHHPQPARGELLRLIREANEEDLALIDGLRDMMGQRRPVLRTRGDRPNRPNRADRPKRGPRADRPDRPAGGEGPDRPNRRRKKAADPEAQG